MPGVATLYTHHFLYLLLFKLHLLLHHSLLLTVHPHIHHHADALNKAEHDASNACIFKSWLWTTTYLQHTACDESGGNGIPWVVLATIVHHQAVNWTEAATPHCEGTAYYRSTVSHMCQTTYDALFAWWIPATWKNIRMRMISFVWKLNDRWHLPFRKYQNVPPKHPIENPTPRSSKIRPGHG